MRFLHLAPTTSARSIKRAGLNGKPWVLTTSGGPVTVRRAVFAMPVVSNFWVTYQWLRELRTQHDERMVAVSFRLADNTPVYVGRYNEPHVLVSASESAAWVLNKPAGAQVVIPHRIAAKQILHLKDIGQLIGWTNRPEPVATACLCPMCLRRGDRSFMRRIRAAYKTGLSAARAATSDSQVCGALATLSEPVHRARGRLEIKKLVPYARSPAPEVRQIVARLANGFKRADALPVLKRLLHDETPEVQYEASEALCSLVGLRQTAELVGDMNEELVAYFVRGLEYQSPEPTVVALLAQFSTSQSAPVQAAVRRVARACLLESGGGPHRPLLQRLAFGDGAADE